MFGRLRSACTGAALVGVLALAGCGGEDSGSPSSGTQVPVVVAPTLPAVTESAVSQTGAVSVGIAPAASFDKPWAFDFLPDGRMLVTEAFGGLRLVTPLGVKSETIPGLPATLNVPYDVLVSPTFATDATIYLSFSELGPTGVKLKPEDSVSKPVEAGLSVMSATLTVPASGTPTLSNVKIIWQQLPRLGNAGEYGGKMTLSPDGRYLFFTAGDRSTFGDSQKLDNGLGKTIRIFRDGTIPSDNPGADKPGILPSLWSLGHRNSYGIGFDATGLLWESEHGPAGGDEFNVIDFGANLGWPVVSWGNHYDGGLIPKPFVSDPFVAPALYWTPAIAPAGMIFYKRDLFASWKNDAILGGLVSKGLVVVRVSGRSAKELDRLPLNARIRDVRQAADGAIWVLEDSPTGRLLRLTPKT